MTLDKKKKIVEILILILLSIDIICTILNLYVKVIEIGNQVVSEYYINDYGSDLNNSWISVSEGFPKPGTYVLLSFENSNNLVIGRYEEDEYGGGNFYAGDDVNSLLYYEMNVNAWRELPEPYKGE